METYLSTQQVAAKVAVFIDATAQHFLHDAQSALTVFCEETRFALPLKKWMVRDLFVLLERNAECRPLDEHVDGTVLRKALDNYAAGKGIGNPSFSICFTSNTG